jgi:hypothetical protein
MDFSCDPIKCIECGNTFPYSNGYFVSHLSKEHNMTLRDYVVKYEYDDDENKIPRCQCGYCKDPVPFRRGIFLKGQKLRAHQNHRWLKEQYVKKYGVPKCESCERDNDNFYRGRPRKNCKKCVSQGKINQGDKALFNTSIKTSRTLLRKYGVINTSQFEKNRTNASKRMHDYNSNWKKNYRIKKYKNTEIYYQSSFEYDFLEICERNEVLDRISNGSSFNFINEDKQYGQRYMSDFGLDNEYEIEIKSTYILKKQGGIKVLMAKKNAVESAGKKYIFILDKDYSEFLNIIKNN